MCLQVLEESSAESVDSFMKLGIGFNSWKLGNKVGDVYETDSEDYRSLTQDTFIELYKKGLIYEDERVNNYCPGCQTTIADSEIDYKDLPSKFVDVKWKVKETGEEVVLMKDESGRVIGFEKLNYALSESEKLHVAFETVAA